MAYDDVLAGRVRSLAPEAAMGLTEKTVFGARCWILDGNLAFGVHDEELVARVGRAAAADAVTRKAARPFDPSGAGTPMADYVVVQQADVDEDDKLLEWLVSAIHFTAQLPEKGHVIRRRTG